jgi:very-short-patch-repair endonuclease
MNRYTHKDESFKTRAKELRNNSTPTERQLWAYLSRKQLNGIKFRRQHVIAPYILDFYCSSKKLGSKLMAAHTLIMKSMTKLVKII